MQLLTVLHFLLASLNADSGYIKIHIEIEGQDVNVVRFYLPNNNFFDGFDSKNYAEIPGGKYFDFEIPLKNSSFIALKINNEFGIPIAATVSDSISIKAKRTQKTDYPDYELTISGSNAAANAIYLQRFYPAGKNIGFFDDLPKNSKSYSEYYIKSKNYIDSTTYVWDSLKLAKKISNEVYDLYKAETKGLLYDVAIRRMSKVNPKDSSWQSYSKWLQLRNVMFYNAEAYNKIHLKTFTGSFIYQNYLRDILKYDDAVQDTILKNSDLGFYYYYDTLYREDAWGRELLAINEMFPTSANLSNSHDLQAFKDYYPNSSYFNKADRFKDSIIAERKNLRIKVNIYKKDCKTMKDVFSSLEGRFFFIDVWATWCGPCIQEFNYYTQISKFLNENKIDEVFLSVDKIVDIDKWANFINTQNLGGNHFILNDKVQKELFNIISEGKGENTFTIPRYLIYDKKYDKYLIDLPRPSTGVVLQGVISNFVKDKGE